MTQLEYLKEKISHLVKLLKEKAVFFLIIFLLIILIIICNGWLESDNWNGISAIVTIVFLIAQYVMWQKEFEDRRLERCKTAFEAISKHNEFQELLDCKKKFCDNMPYSNGIFNATESFLFEDFGSLICRLDFLCSIYDSLNDENKSLVRFYYPKEMELYNNFSHFKFNFKELYLLAILEDDERTRKEFLQALGDNIYFFIDPEHLLRKTLIYDCINVNDKNIEIESINSYVFEFFTNNNKLNPDYGPTKYLGTNLFFQLQYVRRMLLMKIMTLVLTRYPSFLINNEKIKKLFA